MSVIYKDLVFWVKKSCPNKKLLFKKIITFSFNIFWWKYYSKISRWYVYNCFNRLHQFLCYWIRTWFLKTGVIKNFAKFTWKRLRPVTTLKRYSSSGVFQQILRIFYRTPLYDCFWIFSGKLVETRFFLLLYMLFQHCGFWIWWISRILQLKSYTLRNSQESLFK